VSRTAGSCRLHIYLPQMHVISLLSCAHGILKLSCKKLSLTKSRETSMAASKRSASVSEQFPTKFCRIISTRCLKRLFELSPPAFPGAQRNCCLRLEQQILCSCVYVKCGTRHIRDRLGRKERVFSLHLPPSCELALYAKVPFLVRCL
jgi:hypothetical protein